MMKINTILTNTIESLDEKKLYDVRCKQILSNKMILAWIMKECASEYKDIEVEEIANKYIEGNPDIGLISVSTGELIGGMSTEVGGVNEGKIVYDIRYRAIAPSQDGLIELLINVEAQNQYHPGYPLVKRGIYYGSEMIAKQNGVDFDKSDYAKIKKVYSIWICPNVPKRLENTITSYNIGEINLVGNVREKKENYDLMSVVMVYLGHARGEQQSSLLKMLNTLLSAEVRANEKLEVLSNEFRIPREKYLESEVVAMCNLSQGIEAKGIEQGRQEEREKAEVEKVARAKEMIQDKLPVSVIERYTGLPVERIKELM